MATGLTSEDGVRGLEAGQFEIASVGTGLFTVTDLDWMSGFILRIDAAGHVSNEFEHVIDPPGSLPGFMERCIEVIEK